MTNRLIEIIERDLGHATPGMLDGSPEGGALLARFIAGSLTEAVGGEHHIVRANEIGWTIQHPLPERFEGTLFECPMTALCAVAAEQGAFQGGDHRVWLDRGVLLWEEIGG